jgi:tRNA G26 N,N-dimethylase Trm1
MAGKSKELFEQMVKESGLNMTYDEFSAEMDAIISMQDPVAREKRLMSCYRGLTTMTATSAIMIRALMSWSDEYYSRYLGKVHSNAVLSEIAVTRVLAAYCQEKEFDYKCESKMGQSNEEYMQFLGGIANNVTMARVHREVFKIADEQLYRTAVNNLRSALEKIKKAKKNFPYRSAQTMIKPSQTDT